ncbi:MAG: DUF3592 domain-containing protein [Candidatus Hydrogenedentes bacterium]|nr:DUF3592 domain-containing protein [Candidatus Hydrogenedentota bacterium]
MALAVGACVPAFSWYQDAVHAAWQRTTGRVSHCEIRETHYNATASQTKVDISYTYDVAGARFSGSWTGYWPETEEESANALPPGRFDELRDSGYPLVVLYDPNNPSQSVIHSAAVSHQLLYKWLFGFLFAVTVYYVVRIYPAWKRASPTL